MELEPLFTKALEAHRPRNLEEVQQNINHFIEELQTRCDEKKIQAVVMLGGSAAKGTMLGDDFDCDVFVRFHYSYEEEKLSDLLEEILMGLDVTRVHGSRDYFRYQRYEIIPVYHITQVAQAKNVTDVSPFHVEWVAQKIHEKNSLRDEILLAKIFAKANRVYGAESYLKGFSGHVLDILTIHYGSFLALLNAATQWGKKETIDIEKHGTVLNNAKIFGPLTVVDPLQPERNAAAALGEEKYALFIDAAQSFLASPSPSFFEENIPDIDALCKDHLVVKIEVVDGKEDIVGAKVVKVKEYLCRELTNFGITSSDFYWDKGNIAYVYFQTEHSEIAASYEHKGPVASQQKHVDSFKEKHSDVFEKEGVLYARVTREFTDVKEHCKALLKTPYVVEKVRDAELL